MVWTYSGDPATSDKDAVRWLIADTDIADQQVSNEEITYALTEAGNVKGAARIVLQRLITQFSALTDLRMGELSISYSQKAAALQQRLDELIEIEPATPWMVLRHSQKDAYRGDDDINVVHFDRRMF